MSSSMDRIENIRVLVNDTLYLDNLVDRKEAYAQLDSVSSLASMLAEKRGLEQEIAAITGLLHNYYFYKTGISYFPGINSAETVRPIIRDLNIFSTMEQLTILRAIFYQNQRRKIHGPYDELIKDSIVLNNYFQKMNYVPSDIDFQMLNNLLNELSIPKEGFKPLTPTDSTEVKTQCKKDKRGALADISEKLADQNIIGVPEDELFIEICHYWPDPDVYTILQHNWCAAFVYHCCIQAGILLPIRYPNSNSRLAGAGAVLEWSQLPETGFFYDDKNFSPQRGDIVVYDKLLSNKPHDHIGIVLDCDDHEVLVAEGNKDNENYSSILRRCRKRNIMGYIRIDNEYEFHFDGDYNPII